MGQSGGRVLLYVIVLVAGCVLLAMINSSPDTKDEEIKELLSAVKELRSLGGTKQRHIDITYDEKDRILTNDSFTITEYWQASSLLKWDFEKEPEYDCKNKSSADIYYICQDQQFRIKTPCLAYSFGVYTKWKFEETLGNMGCETHSFDPSVPWDDHIHKKVVNFHKMGIGAYDTDNYKPPIGGMYVKSEQTWKMRTLPSIMKMLGHEGRVIDVLKVDVEGWEWFMVEQMLETGLIHRVRQLVVEWHLIRDFPKKSSYIHLLKLYYRMKDAGFRTFSVDFRFPGFTKKRWRIQCDTMYVNTKFRP